MSTSSQQPCWQPFRVLSASQGARELLAPRSLHQSDRQGIGDRLRAAAFAEMQAEAAFLWAADHYTDAPEELRQAWRRLALEENKHRGWLMRRMEELRFDVADRPVSDVLWVSLVSCATAREFCQYMAGAEERGRRAGERFCDRLKEIDPVTAEIFGKIALDEVSHIELARRFYP